MPKRHQRRVLGRRRVEAQNLDPAIAGFAPLAESSASQRRLMRQAAQVRADSRGFDILVR